MDGEQTVIPAMGIFVYAIGSLVWATAIHTCHTILVVAMPAAGAAVFVAWLVWRERPIQDREVAW